VFPLTDAARQNEHLQTDEQEPDQRRVSVVPGLGRAKRRPNASRAGECAAAATRLARNLSAIGVL
jgi:hypothetical protein